MPIEQQLAAMEGIAPTRFYGTVATVRGLIITCSGLESLLRVGDRCRIERRGMGGGAGKPMMAEVTGFEKNYAILMPFGELDGIGPGARVELIPSDTAVRPDASWLGRIVNAFGEPLDGKGPLGNGPVRMPVRGNPPPAQERARVAGKIDLGVRCMNTFLSCCRGQRMGIFAGSGVGKSILMSMLAKYSQASINVIGLIGERGREVQEFIEDDLGEEGMARSVVVVATSSEPALMRREAAYLTLAVAEYFRDEGRDVLCLMDSVTRFAMAQREIGLSTGEPPTSKGYTPTVFAELPRLLERAGPGIRTTDGTPAGTITGLFTVLVEGDDTNEPIADAVRGILDGHIVLERKIAERGRFPAINVLRSVSRTMPECNSGPENEIVQAARSLLSTYEDMAEMIRLGAYRRGSDPAVDTAIQYYPQIEAFLSQKMDEPAHLAEDYVELAKILGIKDWSPAPKTGIGLPLKR